MARFIAYQSPQALFEPTIETIKALEEVIRWAEVEVPHNLHFYMNDLVMAMALTNQKIARKMSFGPYDSKGHDTSMAWKIPVRRITERYYLGWKIRQISEAVWQLYNDSREAYYIEFGINWLGEGRRVRRPIRKLSLRRTMETMMRTTAYHRIWVDIYSNPRTRNRRGKGFTQIVQSPAMGTFGGPQLGRYLP
jgi:hypothetical protein